MHHSRRAQVFYDNFTDTAQMLKTMFSTSEELNKYVCERGMNKWMNEWICRESANLENFSFFQIKKKLEKYN